MSMGMIMPCRGIEGGSSPPSTFCSVRSSNPMNTYSLGLVPRDRSCGRVWSPAGPCRRASWPTSRSTSVRSSEPAGRGVRRPGSAGALKALDTVHAHPTQVTTPNRACGIPLQAATSAHSAPRIWCRGIPRARENFPLGWFLRASLTTIDRERTSRRCRLPPRFQGASPWHRRRGNLPRVVARCGRGIPRD